jgi:adenine phosphoribosyltransferase
MELAALIRSIPDHPKPGILFRDITTLLKDAEGFRLAIARFARHYRDARIAKVAAVEARGFIIGAAIAHELKAGFVPLRKPGKLPAPHLSEDYQLEYGMDRLQVHVDALHQGERVLVADDLIATGGTAEAACKLVERCGARVVECCFVIELRDLGGRARLAQQGHGVYSLLEFEGH